MSWVIHEIKLDHLFAVRPGMEITGEKYSNRNLLCKKWYYIVNCKFYNFVFTSTDLSTLNQFGVLSSLRKKIYAIFIFYLLIKKCVKNIINYN